MNPLSTLPVILIVEDTAEHAAVIQAALEYKSVKADMRVVASGEEAMDYLEGVWPFDDRVRDPMPSLVVLDHWLPEASGLEVLEWIRNHDTHAELPVVIFTASHNEAHEARARELGVHAFKVKPDDFGDLAETVRSVLNELIEGAAGEGSAESEAG